MIVFNSVMSSFFADFSAFSFMRIFIDFSSDITSAMEGIVLAISDEILERVIISSNDSTNTISISPQVQ